MSGPAALAVATDLRLVPPAVAAWCAALVVVQRPQAVADTVAVPGALLAAVAVAVLVATVRHVVRGAGRAGPGHPRRGRCAGDAAGRRALPAVVLCVVTAATVLVSGGVAQGVRAPHGLAAAVADGRSVEVVGRVSDEPRPAGGADPRVRFTLAASAVRVDGTWRRVECPVDVVAPAGAARDAQVRVRGVPVAAARGERAAVQVRAARAPVVGAPPRPFHAWAAQVRGGAHDVARSLPPDVRGLLPAVTVGDTDAVPDDLVAAMRTAGLTHVMAVSGAHFAILGALVLALTAALHAPLPVRAGAVAAAGAGLLLVVGPAPSVVRAAVMGAVGLAGLLLGRRAAGPAALAAAVVGLLVADPWLAVDVGFALSVAATAGLVVLGARLVDRWAARCGREVAALLAAPVAAQVGCLPVALALWPTFGPWAVAANLAVTPAVAPATVLGLLAALLAGPWPAGAAALAAAAGAACWWVAAVARCTAGLPGAALAWLPGPGGAAAAAVVALAVTVLVLRPSRP